MCLYQVLQRVYEVLQVLHVLLYFSKSDILSVVAQPRGRGQRTRPRGCGPPKGIAKKQKEGLPSWHLEVTRKTPHRPSYQTRYIM